MREQVNGIIRENKKSDTKNYKVIHRTQELTKPKRTTTNNSRTTNKIKTTNHS